MIKCPCCGQDMPPVEGFRVDLDSNTLIIDGVAKKAMPKIAEVAHILAEAAPRIVRKETIMDRLYGSYWDDPPQPKIVDIFIYGLRKLVAGTRFEIQTSWGCGFRLTTDRSGVNVHRQALIECIEQFREATGYWPSRRQVVLSSPYENDKSTHSALFLLQKQGRLRQEGDLVMVP
jgi:DNA-binding winged helix-turn-helix (wHTH) protein